MPKTESSSTYSRRSISSDSSQRMALTISLGLGSTSKTEKERRQKEATTPSSGRRSIVSLSASPPKKPDKARSTVWQHPYVDIFKRFSSQALRFGDVQSLMDGTIGKRVYKLAGDVPAVNFLQFPRSLAGSNATGLGLTGRYCYLQLRVPSGSLCTFHLDILTGDKRFIRLTFSTMYSDIQLAGGTHIRIPLRAICVRANFVAHSLSDRWTVVRVDLPAALEEFSAGHSASEFYCLKAVKVCSSCLVRGIYTSDVDYTPMTLPRDIALPVTGKNSKGGPKTWEDLYDWVALPHSISFERDDEGPLAATSVLQKEGGAADEEPVPSPREAGEVSQEPEMLEFAVDYTELRTEAPESERQELNMDLDEKDWQRANEEMTKEKPDKSDEEQNKENIPSAIYQTFGYSFGMSNKKKKPLATTSALSLFHLLGLSTDSPSAVLWAPGGKHCVAAIGSSIVIMGVPPASSPASPSRVSSSLSYPPSTVQGFLHGHQQNVSLLAFSADTKWLASAESGPNPRVRIWDFTARQCVQELPQHFAYGMQSLQFSPSSSSPLLLLSVGLDQQRRQQIVLWDLTELPTGGRPKVRAKQTSDFNIVRAIFSPLDRGKLVSCGRENIRFWRLDSRQHLPGTPVVLKEYGRGVRFNDLSFSSSSLFVASDKGTLLKVNPERQELECVYRLHNASISCFCISMGLCVTGGEEGMLRLWPLSFSSFFLEAEHEGGISSLSLSEDGLRILVGTRSKSLGYLDIPSQRYQSLLRAHSGTVLCLAVGRAKTSHQVATASEDGTIRVWDLNERRQIYEFSTGGTTGEREKIQCLSLAFSPSSPELAAGLSTGDIRVWSLTADGGLVGDRGSGARGVHRLPIGRLLFHPRGRALLSADSSGVIAVYDPLRAYEPVRVLDADLGTDEYRGVALSANGELLAVLGTGGREVLLYDPLSLLFLKRLPVFKSNVLSFGSGVGEGGEAREERATTITFSADSLSLIIVTSENRIIRSCIETGSHQRSSRDEEREILALATFPGGRYLCTSTSDGKLQVWDSNNLRGISPQIFSTSSPHPLLAFSCCRRFLISASLDGTIFFWKFNLSQAEEEIAEIQPLTPPKPREDHTKEREKREGEDEERPAHETPQPLTKRPPQRVKSIIKPAGPGLRLLPPTRSLPVRTNREKREEKVTRPPPPPPSLAPLSSAGCSSLSSLAVRWDSAKGRLYYALGRYLVVEDLEMKAQHHIEAHTDPIGAFTLSLLPSLRFLASTDGNDVKLWDIEGDSSLTLLSTSKWSFPQEYIQCVESTGNYLVVVSSNTEQSTIVSLSSTLPRDFYSRITVYRVQGTPPSLHQLSSSIHRIPLYDWAFIPAVRAHVTPRSKPGKRDESKQKKRTQGSLLRFVSVDARASLLYIWQMDDHFSLSYALHKVSPERDAKVTSPAVPLSSLCLVSSSTLSWSHKLIAADLRGKLSCFDLETLRFRACGALPGSKESPRRVIFRSTSGYILWINGSTGGLSGGLLKRKGLKGEEEDQYKVERIELPSALSHRKIFSLSCPSDLSPGADCLVTLEDGDIWHINLKARKFQALFSSPPATSPLSFFSFSSRLIYQLSLSAPQALSAYSVSQRQMLSLPLPSLSSAETDPNPSVSPSSFVPAGISNSSTSSSSEITCITSLCLEQCDETANERREAIALGFSSGLLVACLPGSSKLLFRLQALSSAISAVVSLCLPSSTSTHLLVGGLDGTMGLVALGKDGEASLVLSHRGAGSIDSLMANRRGMLASLSKSGEISVWKTAADPSSSFSCMDKWLSTSGLSVEQDSPLPLASFVENERAPEALVAYVCHSEEEREKGDVKTERERTSKLVLRDCASHSEASVRLGFSPSCFAMLRMDAQEEITSEERERDFLSQVDVLFAVGNKEGWLHLISLRRGLLSSSRLFSGTVVRLWRLGGEHHSRKDEEEREKCDELMALGEEAGGVQSFLLSVSSPEGKTGVQN